MENMNSKRGNNSKARKIYIKTMGWDSIPNGYEVHHIIPVKKGGLDDFDNLVLIHNKYHNNTYMHCWKKKNPSKEELLIEEVILSFYTTLKDAKIKPKFDNDAVKCKTCKQFLIDNKDEIFRLKFEERLSNQEIVDYPPFEGKLGTVSTFRRNLQSLGWYEQGFNDNKNGIKSDKISQAMTGENHPMYGKTGEEAPFYGRTHTKATIKKMKEKCKNRIPPNKGKSRSVNEEIKQERKNERLKKYKRWETGVDNDPDLTMEKFCEKEEISYSTLQNLIKEFYNFKF